MKKILTLQAAWISVCILLLSLSSCRKSTLVMTANNEVNITSYLKEHPEHFSEISNVLEKSGTASFLDAYGSYTFFAPDNNAVKAYLTKKGKNNIDEINKEEWINFVRFHLLEDSIPTSRFTDGKLKTLTMYGQYLVTGSQSIEGVTKIRVNRQANITRANISVGNGLIHTIDAPLEPANLTVAQILEQDADNYSIFTEALKATGLYDMLNKLPAENTNDKEKWLTVIAEKNSVLEAANITSYAQLKETYSPNADDVTSISNPLNLFMRYHILYEAKYLADIISESAHNTLAPLEVLTSKLSGEKVLINDDIFNGVHEPGFELTRNVSDVSANNGVIHQSAKHFTIKMRSPFRVDFDVCKFPEMLKNTEFYGKQSYAFTKVQAESLTEIKFSGSIQEGSLTTNVGLIYRQGSAGTSNTSVNRDVLVVPLDPVGTANRPKWVEFKTPLLVKGKYKVWLGYYAQAQSSSNGGSNIIAQASIGQENSTERTLLSNSRTISFSTKRPGQPADVEEAIGWKIYTEPNSGSQVARLMGIADIPQTGRYWIRIEAIGIGNNGSQNTNNIDLIQFIPLADDQQYPRFRPNGELISRP
jgi:uncharacterized surface protein with fasciclin (FAS1) repeats